MPRRLVSLITAAPGAPRGSEPSLEVNAYAVSQDVDLTVVLMDGGVRLAIDGSETRPVRIADAPFPPASPTHDLRALLESGIAVLVLDADMAAAGLQAADLIAGVEIVDEGRVADVLAHAQGVLTW